MRQHTGWCRSRRCPFAGITQHSLAALVGIVLPAGGLALAQAADPLVGTWKLNTGKSGTTTVEKDGDGKGNAVTGHSPYGDAVAIERVDARTHRFISKMGGKVTTTQTLIANSGVFRPRS